MRPRYRVGGQWKVTIIREGIQIPDKQGRRPDDLLIGTMQYPEWAQMVVNALNTMHAGKDSPGEATVYICPWCRLSSSHPEDITNRYCARCDQFEDDRRLWKQENL